MDAALSRVQADFDRIAQLKDDYDANAAYHDLLLRHVPNPCAAALEVGCGSGAFARQLAQRAEHVLALDVSGGMIQAARARSTGAPQVQFEQADVMTRRLPADHFDCVTSIATLHHLPLGPALRRLATCLRPGGRLLIVDLVQPHGPADWVRHSLALPANLLLRLRQTGRLRAPSDVRAAWFEHARHDRYPTLGEVRRLAREILPGARVQRRLLWRYSLIWTRPGGRA